MFNGTQTFLKRVFQNKGISMQVVAGQAKEEGNVAGDQVYSSPLTNHWSRRCLCYSFLSNCFCDLRISLHCIAKIDQIDVNLMGLQNATASKISMQRIQISRTCRCDLWQSYATMESILICIQKAFEVLSRCCYLRLT